MSRHSIALVAKQALIGRIILLTCEYLSSLRGLRFTIVLLSKLFQERFLHFARQVLDW
jgi:hypothetical protein